MNDEIHTNQTTLQGESLFYREAGQGLPVVLLHAGIADSRMWLDQMRAWRNDFHLVAPDLPGFGQSAIPNRPFSYLNGIAGLLDVLELDSVWLVGASFGGRLALDFCLESLKQVRGLVLVSPLVSGLDTGPDIAAFSQREQELLEAGDIQAATELNLRTWVDGPQRSPKDVNGQIRWLVANMQMQAFQMPAPPNARALWPETSAGERLMEVRVPTLIVTGNLDLPVVADHARQLAERLPEAEVATIPGTAHLPSLEQPEAFNLLVWQFIQQVEEKHT